MIFLIPEVISNVNDQLAKKDVGRLFAVVSIAAKQKKITTDDLVIVEDIFPPTVGDRIRLEKVRTFRSCQVWE